MLKSRLFPTIMAALALTACGVTDIPTDPGQRPTCANVKRDANAGCVDVHLDAQGKTTGNTVTLSATQGLNTYVFVTHDGGDAWSTSTLNGANVTIVRPVVVTATNGQTVTHLNQVGSAKMRKYDIGKHGAGFQLLLTTGEYSLQINGVAIEGFTLTVTA